MLIALAFVVAQTVAAAPAAVESLVGELSELGAGQLTVRTDAGAAVVVRMDQRTKLVRSQPGATSLEGAAALPPSELAVGDRVLAHGTYTGDRAALRAARIVVMKKADIQARREQERADWRRRGLGGVISGLDATSREIAVRLRGGPDGPRIIRVSAAAAGLQFRRYASHSARFGDSRPSRYEELAVGDQVRMLGERSADGDAFLAEQIVAGAFRTVRGRLLAVDLARGELRLRVQNGRVETVTVTVGPDVRPRRLPTTSRSERGPDRGGLDEAVERGPELALADLVVGEQVAVLGPRSDHDERLLAIKLLAGLSPPLAEPEDGRGGQEREHGGGGPARDVDEGPDMLGSGGEDE